MFRKFRTVEGTFIEPSMLGAVSVLGHISLKQGALLLRPTSIVMEGPGGDAQQTYFVNFAVSEPKDDFEFVEHELRLVEDLEAFEYEGEATLLGNLAGLGNCGGYLFLVSPEQHPVNLVQDVSGLGVTSRLAPTH